MPSGSGGRQAAPGGPQDDEDWEPTPAAPKAEKPTRAKRAAPKFTHWRVVKRRRCRACQAWTWVGFDADVAAGLARVDVGAFLTEEGEARAIARGRATYDYVEIHSVRLDHRDDWSVAGRPAGSRFLSGPNLVVADHVCGRPVPAWALFKPPRPPRRRRSDLPPF